MSLFFGRQARLRREAAVWFARLRGPDRDAHRAEFERWIGGDARRQEAFDRLVRLWDDASILHDSALAAAALRPRPMSARTPPFALTASLACAILAAVITVAAVLGPMRGERLASAVGRLRAVPLADGSRLLLDADSAVTVAYSPWKRRVRLQQGRARFLIAADRRPFEVMAARTIVTAHGTLFDVGLESPRVEVSLLRGSVDVASPTSRRGAVARIRMTPGETLSVVGSSRQTGRLPVSPSGDWSDGWLCFEDEPLWAVLAQVNRYDRRKIRLSDASLGGLRVTGAFQPRGAAALADSLASSFDLEARRQADGDLLLARRAQPDPRRAMR